MRKINLLFFCLALTVVQGCSGDVKDDDEPTTTTKDTTKIAVPLDRDDAQFAVQAAYTGLTEIALGKLAIKNGLDKRIKNSGAMMIKDHAKAGDKLQLIAKNKKITLPQTIDSAEQKSIDNLSKNTGAAFDKAYLNEMIKQHQANVKLFQTASKQVMDPDLRRYAAKNLLVYKRHLDMINELKGSMKE